MGTRGFRCRPVLDQRRHVVLVLSSRVARAVMSCNLQHCDCLSNGRAPLFAGAVANTGSRRRAGHRVQRRGGLSMLNGETNRSHLFTNRALH